MVVTAPGGIPASSRPAGGPPPSGGSGPALGFIDDTSFTVEWDDSTPFPGMVVTFTAPTIGEYMALLHDTGQPTEDDQGIIANLEQRTFAQCLVAWNVRDRNGAPVPATLAASLTLSRPLYRAIIRRWLSETVDVPVPLDGPSTSGEISALESLETGTTYPG